MNGEVTGGSGDTEGFEAQKLNKISEQVEECKLQMLEQKLILEELKEAITIFMSMNFVATFGYIFLARQEFNIFYHKMYRFLFFSVPLFYLTYKYFSKIKNLKYAKFWIFSGLLIIAFIFILL